jgi:hypothetical protein
MQPQERAYRSAVKAACAAGRIPGSVPASNYIPLTNARQQRIFEGLQIRMMAISAPTPLQAAHRGLVSSLQAFVDAYSALNWESLGMLEDGTINLDAESQVVNNGEQEARDSAQKLDSRRERRRYSFARLSAGVGGGHRREDVYR